jgi:hypothetical protein
MDFDAAKEAWRTDGFAVLPAYLGDDLLAPALGELEQVFPSASGFHDGTDERRTRFIGDEFDGIDDFPFPSVELSLLAVSPPLVELAQELLGEEDVRLYSAEAWAKFTGAAEYDQLLHRDYLGHTVVVPTDAAEFRQVEMFVYLVDVSEELGPPHLVSRKHTGEVPARPNWYPRGDIVYDDDFVSQSGRPDWYAAEASGAGPAGTVIAFAPDTFHRGTGLSAPRGARYSMQLCFRPASLDWGQRAAWAKRSHSRGWYLFVERATHEQLALFGFPRPGHPYWTPETVRGVGERYPGLDMTPWKACLDEEEAPTR